MMVQEAECPVVVLASGQILKMRGVLLYDETLIRELAAFKTMVAGKLGMQATGQAFIRSPAWMLGAAAVKGIFEQHGAYGAGKESATFLAQAEVKSQAVVDSAAYCDPMGMGNAHLPHPELWFFDSVQTNLVDLGSLGWSARKDFLRRHNRAKTDVQDNQVSVELHIRYVHNGDDFLNVETDIGPMNIRWSTVAAYAVPRQPISPKKLTTRRL